MQLSTEPPSLISTTVDFDLPGLQTGVLRLPHSHNRSAYGHIPIPLAVLNGGAGPTVLLAGGNHGDEYEGPVALMRLVQRMPQMRIAGRLIVIPGLNMPALLNGSRTSPIDGANLNRVFPGKAKGTPTELIAHYVEHQLLPLADLFIDIHSGGASMNYLPTLFVTPPQDVAQRPLYMRLAQSFAAPHLVRMDILGETRTSGSAALRQGVMFFTGEFGGSASCSAENTRDVEAGLEAMLRVYGILDGGAAETRRRPSRFMQVDGHAHYLFAPRAGIFAPSFALGDEVSAGQLAGHIHNPQAPWEAPQPLHFAGSGKVICMRTLAGVEAGDCLGHLASDATWD